MSKTPKSFSGVISHVLDDKQHRCTVVAVINPAGGDRRAVAARDNVQARMIADIYRPFREDGVRLGITGPIMEYARDLFRLTTVRTSLNRNGRARDSDKVCAFAAHIGWAAMSETGLMNVIEELEHNMAEAARIWDTYSTQLASFRSVIKNDIDSLQASARKTTDAVAKMNKAYSDVFAQLNGPEMTTAIENAERLARALDAISNLQSHRMTFAVVDAQRGE